MWEDIKQPIDIDFDGDVYGTVQEMTVDGKDYYGVDGPPPVEKVVIYYKGSNMVQCCELIKRYSPMVSRNSFLVNTSFENIYESNIATQIIPAQFSLTQNNFILI